MHFPSNWTGLSPTSLCNSRGFGVSVCLHSCRVNNAIIYIVASDILHSLQWRHNGHDGVSNHQPLDCLLNGLFRRRSKKTAKLRVTGLCEGNSPVTGEFPAQRASNAERVSIWWRHHVLRADTSWIITALQLHDFATFCRKDNIIIMCVTGGYCQRVSKATHKVPQDFVGFRRPFGMTSSGS